MSDERLIFTPVKAYRGWYVVEYGPPVYRTPFATISLTIIEPAEPAAVAEAMESELSGWLARYPVPIMVSAFDIKSDLIDLTAVREFSHLFGWRAQGADTVEVHWRLVQSTELPTLDLTSSALRRIYADVPYETGGDLRQGAAKQQRTTRLLQVLVFACFIVVPGAWLVMEFNAPRWLEWGVLLYGLSQLYIHALKLTGLWPKTAADQAADEEQLRQRHHHYHCERNPEGFRRLVAENVERESREQTMREVAELKRTAGDKMSGRGDR